jgi:glutamyl-tRNA synthetase
VIIKTRFAPSPTGFLHIGGARTALFSWAFARHNKGKFILRVEDTDVERSTQESVDSILDAMQWLNLSYDEGPFYQMQRMERYKSVIQQMLADGSAYYCYCSREELDALREEQMSNKEKPRYNRKCLNNHEHDQTRSPVVRFKNPTDGVVVWNDLVKGRIEIANSELDDLIIARSDGTPTYNFCVVVDDWDMQITHVTRGDDHVNNTPRQINILQALGAPVPQYAHLPMILRDDGQKMSKRRDPVSVMQYQEMGILPEALLNYLSRLCWGHGDDEVFSIAQFVEWFNLDNISPSPARFDMKKLFWVNSQHIKNMDNVKLLEVIEPGLIKLGIDVKELDITSILDLVKTRGDNLNTITQEVAYFYQPQTASQDDVTKHLTDLAISLLNAFANALDGLDEWSLEAIKAMVKEFCAVQNIKMPQLGMPLRLKLCGTTQTPSFDAVLYILGKNNVLSRLSKSIS